MAGLFISINYSNEDKIRNQISSAIESFEKNRFLERSFSYNNDIISVSKYKRKGETNDINLFDDNDVCIFVVGFVIYGKNVLADSISAIANDIKSGKDITLICDELDGTFCLVIFKKHESIVHAITDVSGIIHIYQYNNDDIHILSTSELAITRNFPVTASLNGITSFLRTTYIPGNDTLFNETKILDPATHYLFDLNSPSATARSYFSFPSEINWTTSYNDARSRLEMALKGIIERLPTEQTLVDFTGGNDSRLITALVYRQGEHKNQISTLFAGPQDSSEYQIMNASCKDLGIKFCGWVPDDAFENNFFSYILDAFELGSGEESVVQHAQILWANLEKKKHRFRYSLHGSGGELCRDARWDQEFGSRGKKQPANLQRLLQWRVFQYEYDFTIFSHSFLPLIKKVPDWFLRIYQNTVACIDPKKSGNTLQLDTIYLKMNMRKWGGRIFSSTNQIITPVCPYLFKAPLQVVLSINPCYRKGARIMKDIAERVSPAVARQKMQTGSPFMVFKIHRLLLFVPFYIFLIKKLIRKLSQVLFGKTVFSRVTVEDFDLSKRFRSALEDSRCIELLTYDKMKTKNLYDRDMFRIFLDKAKQPGFKHYKILGGIITLELAMQEAKLTSPIEISQESDTATSSLRG